MSDAPSLLFWGHRAILAVFLCAVLAPIKPISPPLNVLDVVH
jgi:hypothetical protein